METINESSEGDFQSIEPSENKKIIFQSFKIVKITNLDIWNNRPTIMSTESRKLFNRNPIHLDLEEVKEILIRKVTSLKDDYACPICLLQAVEPAKAPCGHYVCLQCIKKLLLSAFN